MLLPRITAVNSICSRLASVRQVPYTGKMKCAILLVAFGATGQQAQGALRDFDVICRTGGAGQALADMRMIKDGDEIAQIRKACGIADAIAAMIEKKVRAGQLKTETDVALFIEKEARKAGKREPQERRARRVRRKNPRRKNPGAD